MDRDYEIAPLLEVDLSVDYPGRPGVLRDIRFTVGRGEIVGVVGPSGSGKSTLALAILRLIELRGGRVSGRILWNGRDLLTLDAAALRQVRGREIGLVLQSPIAALNPALRIETQLHEVWRAHSRESWRVARPWVDALLDRMDLPCGDEFLRRYPRQLSVGQAQRVAIAMAALHRPELLLADEPTSALDPEARGGILDLFECLNRDLGISILYVSHDIPSVERLCGRTLRIDAGRLTATVNHDLISA
jgi:ABC-type glutathione transport system ATPase component